MKLSKSIKKYYNRLSISNSNLVTVNRPSQFIGCEMLGELLLNNEDVQKIEVNYSETGSIDIMIITFTNNTKTFIEIH